MSDHPIYKTPFSKVYPFYVEKAEKKERSKAEVDEILRWLTGYEQSAMQSKLDSNADFEEFFSAAPCLNPDRKKITGSICGVRVEEVKEPLMQEIRYLDKLVDELAKGKAMAKILRQ